MAPRSKNPFRPSYGASPPLLAGRDDDLLMFDDALDEGPGAPARALLVVGQRGMGKTVMLNGVEDLAKERGWITIAETAHEGLIHRINEQVSHRLHELDPARSDSTVTGIGMPMGLGSLSWATEDQYERVIGTRSLLTRLLDVAENNGTGVLITVDEIHGGAIGELRELTTLVQHGIREDRDLAFAAAGLPAALSERLLNDPVLTFLRRSERVDVGPVGIREVREALREPIMAAGRGIGDDALEAATNATGGYPFLIQLVGYHAWRQQRNKHWITVDDVASALPAVADRLGRQVIEPALQPLSNTDRRFLHAMALDDGHSRMADVAERMGVSTNYANQYRARLLDTELIATAGHGQVALALPGLRHHLNSTGDVNREPDDGTDVGSGFVSR